MLQFINDNSWLIPLLSAIIAACSLLISLGSRRVSKAALKITKAQEARRQERLSVELVSVTRKPDKTDFRYVYELAVSNTSDRANSVSRAELRIVYLIDAQQITAVFDEDRGTPSTLSSALTSFGANEAARLSLQFRVARAALNNRPVDYAILVLTDTWGTTYPVRSEHIREL